MLVDVSRHPGLYGTVHDNSLIDVCPFSGGDLEAKFDPKLRVTKPGWLGLIDCVYTPTSLETGRIRSIVHHVRYRLCTTLVMDRAIAILKDLSCYHVPGNEVWDWRIFVHGCSFSTTEYRVS